MQARGIYGVVLFLWLLPITGIAARATFQTDNSHNEASPPSAAPNDHVLLIFTDSAGNPISPPDKSVLQLHIHGKPIEIEEIRSLKDSPLVFSMLVDVSGSTREFADAQIAAASRLFRELSSGGAHGYLIVFSNRVVMVDRFVDAEGVDRALRAFPPPSRTGITALYDAVLRATSQLNSAEGANRSRRAMFIFSDGGDDHSHTNLDAITRAAQGGGIPIFSIGYPVGMYRKSTPEEAESWENLKRLSRATGGLATLLNEPRDPLSQFVHLMGSQCLISFKRPPLEPKKSYEMKVQSSAKDFRILAPTAYLLQ